MIGKLRLATFVFATGVAAILFATGLFLNQQSARSKSGVDTLRTIIGQNPGTIEISGIIVDQDGVALDGVGIEVAEVDPADMFGELRNREVVTVDREFRVTRRGVDTVDCSFFKEGYYDVRHSFSIPKGSSAQEEVRVKRADFTVVLTKVPEPASLERIEGYLSSSAHGPSSVLVVPNIGLGAGDETHEIILDPGTKSNGELRVVEGTIEGVAGPQPVLEFGRLIISPFEAGDGFIAADVTSEGRPEKYGFRKMRGAPTEGYSPFLPIAASSSEEAAFFYCRIGGRYGKGVVTSRIPIIEKDGVATAGARIVVFLNPTGVRDVSFIHF